MTQTIDPLRLKEAAEQLEYVLLQYPHDVEVQGLLRDLQPLLEDARNGKVLEPVDSIEVPGAYNFADGRYQAFSSPSVGAAYSAFCAELRGGLTEQERRLAAKVDAMRAARTERSV